MRMMKMQMSRVIFYPSDQEDEYGKEDEENLGDKQQVIIALETEQSVEVMIQDHAAIDTHHTAPNDRNAEERSSHNESEEDDIHVTPGELLDFMIKRAKRNPQAFIVLLDLRFNELIFMLLRSESNAAPALYCTAMKYAMLLTVNTNAHHYVEMMCNFNIDRACMSEAERKINDQFILFRKTKNGKNIFADRFVEWTMRDIRKRLGKIFKDSTPTQLTSILLQMEKSKQLQDNNPPDPTKKSKKACIKLDNAFLEPYVWCESSNLWLGKPMTVAAKPYFKRTNSARPQLQQPLGSPKHLYATDNGKQLMKDVLSTISRGYERAEHYFNKFHVNGNVTETSRPHKETNLKQVMVNDAAMKIELDLAVSLDKTELQKSRVYTVERIKQELSYLNALLDNLNLGVVNPEKQTKNHIWLMHYLKVE